MVDLAEIQTAYYLVAATGVLVVAFYYVYNMKISQRNQELSLKAQQQNLETRQAQLFMNVVQTSFSNEYQTARNKIKNGVKDWDDFLKHHDDQEWNTAFYNVAGYYEGIGVLVRENLVGVRLVSLLSSGELTGFWDRWGTYFIQGRKYWNFPRYAIEIEYLANQIKEYGKEHPELQIVSYR